MGVAAVARTVSLILTVLLVPLCVACGQEATSSVPAAPPSGARLLWQGTIAAEDPLAIPDEPATTTGDGFWVSCSVSGDTGEGRNATIAFVPVPAETASPCPTALDTLGGGRRVNDGDTFAFTVEVPAGTWAWTLQKGLGYSVEAVVYALP